MYVIVQFPEYTKEVKIAVTTNHFDAGYQYNLLASDEDTHAFLFKIDDSVESNLSLDPDKFDFETMPGAKVLAINGESYSGHEDEEEDEAPCTCEDGHPYDNLCCPTHGRRETGDNFGI